MKIFTDSKKLNIAIICGMIISLTMLLVGITYALLGKLMPYHLAYLGLSEKTAYTS